MSDEKKNYLVMYGGWLIAFILLFLWCMLGRGTGESISNNSNGTEQIRNEHQSISNHQQTAEKYVDAGQVRLGRVTSCVSELQAGTESSAELIAECQYIISQVRKRGAISQTKD